MHGHGEGARGVGEEDGVEERTVVVLARWRREEEVGDALSVPALLDSAHHSRQIFHFSGLLCLPAAQCSHPAHKR